MAGALHRCFIRRIFTFFLGLIADCISRLPVHLFAGKVLVATTTVLTVVAQADSLVIDNMLQYIALVTLRIKTRVWQRQQTAFDKYTWVCSKYPVCLKYANKRPECDRDDLNNNGAILIKYPLMFAGEILIAGTSLHSSLFASFPQGFRYYVTP